MTVAGFSDAEAVTVSRGGRWYGYYGTLPCPICQPAARPGQNALTLADGAKGLLAHCKKMGCAFRDIVTALGIAPGTIAVADRVCLIQRAADRLAEAEKRARQAQSLWSEVVPIWDTPAETYLRGRGITCALPDTLRFHPEVWHGPTARRLPAMVARVDGAAAFAVHRTYLTADGCGKADVAKGTDKLMLGACAGGAIRLSFGSERLVVAEGIETALSLACGFIDGSAAIWAAMSTSGMTGLRLPDKPGRLTIAPDGDIAGRSAALTLADRAARIGWQVSILTAPDGSDFNDLLCSWVTK